MGLETIAEFVESEEILLRLKAIGVDYVQGYGVCRPFPIKRLLESSAE
jgi:EAL domain-containing protein (putative c-di-GMP-specific phosphodiesterase class I)